MGSHGITILDGDQREGWLPLAPDVAITLSAKLDSCAVGIYPESFVEAHNRAAFEMSERVAGCSRRVIEDLLNTFDG